MTLRRLPVAPAVHGYPERVLHGPAAAAHRRRRSGGRAVRLQRARAEEGVPAVPDGGRPGVRTGARFVRCWRGPGDARPTCPGRRGARPRPLGRGRRAAAARRRARGRAHGPVLPQRARRPARHGGGAPRRGRISGASWRLPCRRLRARPSSRCTNRSSGRCRRSSPTSWPKRSGCIPPSGSRPHSARRRRRTRAAGATSRASWNAGQSRDRTMRKLNEILTVRPGWRALLPRQVRQDPQAAASALTRTPLRAPSAAARASCGRTSPLDHPDFGTAVPCRCAEQRDARGSRRPPGALFADRRAVAPDVPADHRARPQREPARPGAVQPVRRGRARLRGGAGRLARCSRARAAAARRISPPPSSTALLERGEPALFVVVPDLLDHLRAAYRPGAEIGYDELFERVRSAPVLVLDDLGTQSPTPWAQEKLFQLINHRFNTRLPDRGHHEPAPGADRRPPAHAADRRQHRPRVRAGDEAARPSCARSTCWTTR